MHINRTYSKGEPFRSPSVFGCYALRAIPQPLRARLLLHTLVLFHGLATNRSSRLRAISHLRVSGRSGDDTLRFATGHADRNATDQ